MAAFFLPPGDGRPFCIHTGTPHVGIGPHDVALSTCVAMVKAGLGWSIVPEICLSYFDGIAEPLFFADDTPLTRSHLPALPQAGNGAAPGTGIHPDRL